MSNGRRRALGSLSVLGLVALAACGHDGGDHVTSGLSIREANPPAVEVIGVDYAYEGLPVTAKVGTELTFANASEVEFHELVLLKLPVGESRSLNQLLALSPAALMSVGEVVGVALAEPGSDGAVVEGRLVMDEAGRYLAISTIPVGADPDDVVRVIADADGGPRNFGPAAGPPHLTRGMAAEIIVR